MPKKNTNSKARINGGTSPTTSEEAQKNLDKGLPPHYANCSSDSSGNSCSTNSEKTYKY